MKNIKIAQKLILSFALMLGIVFVLGVFWQIGMHKQKKMSAEQTSLLQLQSELRRMQMLHYKWVDDLRQAVRTKSEFKGQLDPTQCAFGKWYYSYHSSFPEIQKLFNDLETPHKLLHETGENVVEAIRENRLNDADKISLHIRTQILTDLMKLYEPFMGEIEKINETIRVSSGKLVRNQKILADTVMLVAVVIIIFFGWTITKSITTPLNEVVSATKMIAEGDLTQQVEVRSEDELGILGGTFNEFSSRLHDMIAQIAAVTQQTAAAALQSSSSSQELASGAEEQQAQTSQVATSVEEMSATVQEVAKNASEAVRNAKNSGDVAKKGGDIIQQTIEGINRIADSSKATAEAVNVLSKNSEQIGDIIGVIDDVADQTNLLALNAAIEAARAGEQGRGFAVVADEVRKLAERTSASTKEIASMVKTMQEGTNRASSAMEKGMKDVDEGVKLAGEAENILKEIVSSSQNVVDLIQQVATATEEQSAVAEEISSNVESVASVTKQTAAGTQQISAASREIAKLSDRLQSLVNKFKLRIETVKQIEKKDYLFFSSSMDISDENHVRNEFRTMNSHGSMNKTPLVYAVRHNSKKPIIRKTEEKKSELQG